MPPLKTIIISISLGSGTALLLMLVLGVAIANYQGFLVTHMQITPLSAAGYGKTARIIFVVAVVIEVLRSLSLVVAGMVTERAVKQAGWLYGGLAGATVFLLLSCALAGGVSTPAAPPNAAAYIVLMALGGLLGARANQRK